MFAMILLEVLQQPADSFGFLFSHCLGHSHHTQCLPSRINEVIFFLRKLDDAQFPSFISRMLTRFSRQHHVYPSQLPPTCRFF